MLKTGFGAIIANLKFVSRLQSLNLSYNAINDDSCRLLAANLILVPELHTLNLCRNKIKDVGCRALVKYLQTGSKRLCELDTQSNHFSYNFSCEIIRQALHFMPNLRIKCCRQFDSH